MPSSFLTAEWRKLAIFNYAVDPAILKPFVPYKTELDFWNNKCYVSVVAFRFLNVKLKGIVIPFHRNFEEINLRFYVRYKEDGKWKRGVTFIKEIVPRSALTIVANRLYGEKYVTHPTKHSWIENEEELKVEYQWKHLGQWDSVMIGAEPNAIAIPEFSEEEFITEHYWGYTPLNLNSTSEYQVQHPRWETYPVNNYRLSIRFEELYGKPFGYLKETKPDSIMLAEGSAIGVQSPFKIK